MVILDSKTFPGVSVDILEHLGMRVRDIEGHGVITGRATEVHTMFVFDLKLLMPDDLMRVANFHAFGKSKTVTFGNSEDNHLR